MITCLTMQPQGLKYVTACSISAPCATVLAGRLPSSIDLTVEPQGLTNRSACSISTPGAMAQPSALLLENCPVVSSSSSRQEDSTMLSTCSTYA